MFAAAGTAVLIWHAGRHASFIVDEWSFIEYRRSGLRSIFTAYNGNLIAAELSIYRALFALAGVRDYGPYRAVSIALHLTCATLVFAYARARVGPVLGFVGALLLLLLGQAYEILYYPGALNHVLVPTCFVLALLCLDRGTVRGDVVAALALGVGLATYASALPLAAAIGLECAVRKQWRRLWVPLIPVVLFGLWVLAVRGMALPANVLRQPGASRVDAMGARGHVIVHNLHLAPAYVHSLAANVVGALTHTSGSVARALAIALLAVGIAWAGIGVGRGWAGRRMWSNPAAARVLTLVVALGLFWLLDAVTRAQYHEPNASRYLYGGVVLVLILIAQVCALLTARLSPKTLLVASAVVLALSFVVVVHNTRVLVREGKAFGSLGTTTRAALAGLELARGHVDPGFAPSVSITVLQITAGPYFTATKDLGSPALTARELAHAPASARLAADTVLISALRLKSVAQRAAVKTGGFPPAVIAVPVGWKTTRHAGCISVRPYPRAAPPDRAGSMVAALPAGAWGIDNEGNKALRLGIYRFGDRPQPGLSSTVQPKARAKLLIPSDSSPTPWRVAIAGTAQFALCQLRSPH